jgi:hypothetical protein
MKSKLTLLALAASASASFAASTLNINNFSSATTGTPIVNSAGAALAVNTFFANGGYFNTTMNWATVTPLDIKAAFVGIDNSTVAVGTRNGLFTGQTFNGVLPGGLAGKNAYIVVADNSDFALATVFAVFNAGVTFTAPDGLGNSSQTISGVNSASVVFGTVRSVTTQPNNLTNANFANGVVMVPEPSAALLGALGALGLLRRRRI